MKPLRFIIDQRIRSRQRQYLQRGIEFEKALLMAIGDVEQARITFSEMVWKEREPRQCQ